jgi:hypothetical protein
LRIVLVQRDGAQQKRQFAFSVFSMSGVIGFNANGEHVKVVFIQTWLTHQKAADSVQSEFQLHSRCHGQEDAGSPGTSA